MSFLPSILSGRRKNSRTTGATFEGNTTLPRIHDDQPPANKSKTGALKARKIVHTPQKEAERLTSAKMSCHFCCRKFGLASIRTHEKQCQRKALQTESKPTAKDCELLPKVDTKHRVEASTSWEPFSCKCQHCGVKYGRHSILMHERRCLHKQQLQATQKTTPAAGAPSTSPDWEGERQDCEPLFVNELLLAPRPKTRTLTHSTMVVRGHTIPSIDGVCHSTIVCEQCGQEVPSDCALVHDKSCRARAQTLSTGAVTFPMLPQVKLRVNEGTSRKTVKKPPTIVCYICGREYGTKSISIHEPQCLKKWQVKNSKLPISQREPLPKKPVHVTVARVVSMEDTVGLKMLEPQGSYSGKLLHEIVDDYFQYCYDEFEKELQPCSKCGRTFAPERLVKHVGKCNAKPLKKQ